MSKARKEGDFGGSQATPWRSNWEAGESSKQGEVRATVKGATNYTTDDINGGWQTVRNRKEHRKEKNNTQPLKKPFSTVEVKSGYDRAFKEGKCFRCLASGHRKAQCRDPIRCFKCLKLGDSSSRCSGPIKQTEPRVKPNYQGGNSGRHQSTYANIVKGKIHAQRRPMEEEFWDERPEEEEIFLPPRTALRPDNLYLQKAAWVKLQAGTMKDEVLYELKRVLVVRHGGDFSSYKIHDTGEGQYLMVFQNEQVRDAAFEQGPYAIPSQQALVQFEKWKVTSGMAFQPPGYQTWIKLTGLPLHLWNEDYLKRVTAKLGIIKNTLPYGERVNQLHSVTIYMATKHPQNIPKNLLVREGDCKKSVKVQLIGWRFAQPGYFHPPDRPMRGQPCNRNLYEQRRHHSPPDPGDSDGNSMDSAWTRGTTVGQGMGCAKRFKPAEKYKLDLKKVASKIKKIGWKRRRSVKSVQQKPRRPVKPKRVSEMPDQEITSTTLNSLMATQKMGAATDPPVVAQKITIRSTVAGVVQIRLGNQTYVQIQPLTYGLIDINFDDLIAAIEVTHATLNGRMQKLQGQVMENIKCGVRRALGIDSNNGQRIGQEKIARVQTEKDKFSIGGGELVAAHLLIEEIELGQGETKIANENLIQQEHELECNNDGPDDETSERNSKPNEEEDFPNGPPGFEGNNYHTPEQARRSPRLHAKHSGPYISVMEKASRLKGDQQAGMKRASGPRTKFNKPDPKYAQTLDPLSAEQAEMVFFTAGVEIEKEMGEKIANLVAQGGGQQTDLV